MYVFQVFVPLGVQIFWLFMFCYFGDRITQRFEDISDILFQMKWYQFPIEMQRNMPLFIALTQKRVYLEGLAGAQCTCEVFKKVFAM